jgi:hypothetical protein
MNVYRVDEHGADDCDIRERVAAFDRVSEAARLGIMVNDDGANQGVSGINLFATPRTNARPVFQQLLTIRALDEWVYGWPFLAMIRSCYAETPEGHLTPGITRRPAPVQELESRRVGGRVHAVVMPPDAENGTHH